MPPLRGDAKLIAQLKQEVAKADSIIASQLARQSAARELIALCTAAPTVTHSSPSPRDERDAERDADGEGHPTMFDLESAERAARPLFGVPEDEALVWRERQLEAVRALCVPGKHLVLVAPTGWGRTLSRGSGWRPVGAVCS